MTVSSLFLVPERISKLFTPLLICLLIGNLVFLLVWGVRATGGLQSLELSAYDMAFRLRPSAPVDDRIVLITETEEDLHRWGYPLSDEVLAQVLDRLGQAGARVIGVDKYRDAPVQPGEQHLNLALKNNPHVVWVSKFGGVGATAVAPPKLLQGSGQVGFNDLIDDPGGIVRRGLLFLDDGETVAYSLPLMMALHYLESSQIGLQPDPSNPQHLRLGVTTIPPFEQHDGGYVGADAAGYQFLLDYAAMPGRFPRFTVTELLEGKVSPEKIRDRIVIVGTTAKSINDYFFTPYSQGLATDQRIYGVELFAHVTSQLLRFAQGKQQPFRILPDPLEYGWLWIWCMLGAAAALRGRTLRGSLAAVVVGGAMLGATCYLAFVYAWWIPLVPPLAGFLLTVMSAASYISSQEKRQRAMLMKIFSRHVSNEVASALWEQRDQFLLGGRPRPQQITATVLFSDIHGFTSVSEKLAPERLMDWLNEYMEAMSQIVSEHHGVVNKYIGDAVMALFGAPLAHTDEQEIAADAVRAVECALAMAGEIARLNPLWVAKGLPEISIRVGIYTGPLVAGSLGGTDRLEYTVIGDTVNIASRLESYDKDFTADADAGRCCRILIGDATLKRLGGRYRTKSVGSVAFKGKEERIASYQVIDRL
ncbi:MAG: adenylate/guanylate cyclase domain-containing protein [Sulfuricellaceae bacterium]|nr:adenylate/guanylate cyclase domain-containing protein [Sulfuricellaceae bacterium]